MHANVKSKEICKMAVMMLTAIFRACYLRVFGMTDHASEHHKTLTRVIAILFCFETHK